jgi:hypothetical protein
VTVTALVNGDQTGAHSPVPADHQLQPHCFPINRSADRPVQTRGALAALCGGSAALPSPVVSAQAPLSELGRKAAGEISLGLIF